MLGLGFPERAGRSTSVTTWPGHRPDGFWAAGRRQRGAGCLPGGRSQFMAQDPIFEQHRFVGILVGDRRRALLDVIAGTAVIYSWDARAARLRFLSRG